MGKNKLKTFLLAGIALTFLAISAYATPPKVIKTTPENEDQNVDPSLKEIRIEFDQDMSPGGHSICGGGPNFPKTTGKPNWKNNRIITMPVKLQPNHEYQLSVNCPSYRNFKNFQGESAVIYPLKFKTGSTEGKSSESSKSPSLLLREGMYAEETEGNLDKAIGIYQQVLDRAGEIQRLAARATYQLGMCYLKKGDKDKAAQYLRQVVSDYSTMSTLARKAENQLEKLGVNKKADLIQEGHNTIDPNGLIHFISPHRISNNGSVPITTRGFINSDFVNLTKMYEENGTAIPFEAKHEGKIYRYSVKFNKPILPGESMVYYTEGTTEGLIKPVEGEQDSFRYYMKHSPNAGCPVLRIKTYLLPKGAKFISTATPEMQKTEKDGRIELRVEKVVPANGSITTEFKYKLGDAFNKPLQLEASPWLDGEVMEVSLRHPTGIEYGTIIYSAQSNVIESKDTWQVISHMYVTEGSISQYTFVEAAAESFLPTYGQTTNWGGNFAAEYTDGNVKLTVDNNGKENTRDISVQGIAYDNEQALYLIRRMPLADGYQGSFLIFAVQGGATVECIIRVLGLEEISVEAGTYKCYKTDLSIYSDDIRGLQHTLWFSADEHKYLVKYDVGGAATMELAKVWQKDKKAPLIYQNKEPHFSVAVPNNWRFYAYESPGPQYNLQLLPPDLKAWAVLVWQKRGTDPDSASALTIAKADFEKMKTFFENYQAEEKSWKEFKINKFEAAQFLATYSDKGSGLKKYDKPKQMVEYRTYIVDKTNVYWFVYRVEKDKFENSKAEFDTIIKSFIINAK